MDSHHNNICLVKTEPQDGNHGNRAMPPLVTPQHKNWHMFRIFLAEHVLNLILCQLEYIWEIGVPHRACDDGWVPTGVAVFESRVEGLCAILIADIALGRHPRNPIFHQTFEDCPAIHIRDMQANGNFVAWQGDLAPKSRQRNALLLVHLG